MPKLQSDNPAQGHESGFTLLEMAIVVVIIAAIVAGTLSMGNSMVGSARLTNTNNKLDAIEKALVAYRLANNRLPCPADPTLTDIAANVTTYGYEAGTPGTCTYTNGAYTMPNYSILTTSTNYQALGMSVVEGVLPVKALGLPDEYQFDGWGRKFAYAVAAAMTSKAGVGTATSPAFVSYGAQANCGAITVQNAGGANRTQVADYVLLSYGPNGHGGYLKGGKQYFMGSDNTAEQTNCHCTATAANNAAYTGTYIQQDPTQTLNTDSLSVFDDIVRYKERWQMQNAYDQYHPGSLLPCTTGFQIHGVSGGGPPAITGKAVAVGDVNGDGIPDLIISAVLAHSTEGAVYVVFGTRTGFPDPLPLSTLNGTNGFEIDGASPGWEIGNALAAGDINGDGIADIIIGNSSNPANSGAGYTFVVFGKSGTWTTPLTLNVGTGNLIDGTQGVRFDGVTASDYSGNAVAAGDINGDGYADLVIGASGAPNATELGYTYVIYGRTGTWPGDGVDTANSTYTLNPGYGRLINGTTGFRLDGYFTEDLVGTALATGDVNGDGYADLIIGSYGWLSAADRGRTYIVFGKNTNNGTFLPTTTVTTTSGSAVITPNVYTDLIVGDNVASVNIPLNSTVIHSCNAGNVTTVGTICTSNITLSGNATATASGTPLTLATEVLSSGAGTLINGITGVVFTGAANDDESGIALATGDINGDGFADVIIGGSGSVSNSQAGRVYVIFGKDTNWETASGSTTLDIGYGNYIDGKRGIRFDGVTANDYLGGRSAVATGDVNGDGIPDLIMSAYNANSSSGYTYVVFGNSAILPSTTITTMTSGSSTIVVGSYTGLQVGQVLVANGIPPYDGVLYNTGTAITACGGGTVCTQNTLTLSTTATANVVAGVPNTPVNVAATILNIGTGTLIDGFKGARFDGPASSYAGFSLATGDLNGDGIPDIVIGADNANSGVGYIYIYNGRASGWPVPAGGNGYLLNGL